MSLNWFICYVSLSGPIIKPIARLSLIRDDEDAVSTSYCLLFDFEFLFLLCSLYLWITNIFSCWNRSITPGGSRRRSCPEFTFRVVERAEKRKEVWIQCGPFHNLHFSIFSYETLDKLLSDSGLYTPVLSKARREKSRSGARKEKLAGEIKGMLKPFWWTCKLLVSLFFSYLIHLMLSCRNPKMQNLDSYVKAWHLLLVQCQVFIGNLLLQRLN